MNMKRITRTILASLVFNSICASVVIDKPGTYEFRGNIIGNPTTSDESGIEITSDNVEINLGGYAVMQMPGNTQPGFKAISVASDLTQVSIKNGVVQDVTGEGVFINDGCANIHIEDILAKCCPNGGIYLDGSLSGTGIRNAIIECCTILSCTGSGGGVARGLYMEGCHNTLVRDSFFNDNDAQMTGSGFGIECVDSEFCQIADCTLASNGGFELGGGVSLINCTDFFIDRVGVGRSIARSSASTSFSTGFYINGCNNIVLNGCESLTNQHNDGDAVGFLCITCTGVILQECLSEAQMGDSGACGFHFENQVCSSLLRCSAKLSKTVTSGTAYGIHLSGSLNDRCSIVECSVEHNKGASSSFGMVDDKSQSTSLFMRNQAFNNGTNYSINYPIGITLPLIQASLSNALTGLPSLSAGDLDNLDIDP